MGLLGTLGRGAQGLLGGVSKAAGLLTSPLYRDIEDPVARQHALLALAAGLQGGEGIGAAGLMGRKAGSGYLEQQQAQKDDALRRQYLEMQMDGLRQTQEQNARQQTQDQQSGPIFSDLLGRENVRAYNAANPATASDPLQMIETGARPSGPQFGSLQDFALSQQGSRYLQGNPVAANLLMPKPLDPSPTREVKDRGRVYTQEFDRQSGGWRTIGQTSQYAPDKPERPSTNLVQVLDPNTGQPRYVREIDAEGMTPYTKPAISPRDINTARQKMTQVAVARRQLEAASQAFEAIQGTVSAGYGQGWTPSEAGKKFDAAIDTLRQSITGLTRVPGVGPMSDYETRLAQAQFPSRGEYESAAAQKLQALEDMISTVEQGYSMLLEDIPGRPSISFGGPRSGLPPNRLPTAEEIRQELVRRGVNR